MVACAGTQLFAQNAKEDVITFSLTRYAQSSVSTSSAANSGNWSDGPTIYKTATYKTTTSDVLKAIAIVLHGNAGYYDSRAQLVLVQGELGGFFGYPYVDTLSDVSTTSGDNIRLATGRNSTNNPVNGALPPGHNQPWGQIFVKESDTRGYVTYCENVSFFFAIQVQECYDCFYLNSFITDTTFRFTERNGPPCCAGSSITTGSGKDRYYITLQFDNTLNNPYLNPDPREIQVADFGGYYPAGTTNLLAIVNPGEFYDIVGGFDGLYPPSGSFYVKGLQEADDGITPDGLAYVDSIKNNVKNPVDAHPYDIYTLRFALNGIATYNWALKFVNKNDSYPDFVGSASIPVTGYGYAQKVCSLFSGTVTIAEKIALATKCCLDQPWYNPGAGQNGGFWFNVADFDLGADIATGNPGEIENYYDTASFDHLGDCVPVNTDLDLSLHVNFNHNYFPVDRAISSPDAIKHYPQPGFEGFWDDGAVFIRDVIPPQGTDSPADEGSVD